MSAQRVLAIVSVLASYLRTHPAASDSLDGISRWWLDGEEDPLIEEVNEALQQLVRHGGLRAFMAADGRTRYALGNDVRTLDGAVAEIVHQLAREAPDQP
jgi:hypothetical protein